MPFKSFDRYDLLYNQLETSPECNFIIFDSKVYYNGEKHSKGKFGNLHSTKQGYISLYELNVDRVINTGGVNDPPAGSSIYPFITKDGNRIAFKTISTSDFDSNSQFAHGDIIKGNYPLSSSIKRTRFPETSQPLLTISDDGRVHGSFRKLTSNRRFVNALKNTFNYYIKMSHHYAFDDTTNPRSHVKHDQGINGWDKLKQEISLIEIPSIFYGSSIEKGSVVLQMFYSGTLMAECRDTKRNGELIQVTGTYNAAKHNGKVAGTVLYNEGFIAMTGSWTLAHSGKTDKYIGTDLSLGRWVDFGVGANDGTSQGNTVNTAYKLDFKGKNYVPTVTMFAHMPKSEFNNSMNPTSYTIGQSKDPIYGNGNYKEFDHVTFDKLEHSDYQDPTGSFNKQTYVSKVGIYDHKKRLIGLAKLANPIRKTEDREYTFKLKMDF